MRYLCFLTLMVALAAGAAEAAEAPRVEIPITQVKGTNGRFYYFIPVTVGGAAPFQALLDSGSTGLRLLPGLVVPGDVEMTRQESRYAYSTGSQFAGHVARARIGIGGTYVQARVQMIEQAGCRADHPDCPAANLEGFGFAREGLIGPPQRARIGIGLGAAEDADNPLALIGNGQWIIELPRPDGGRPGRLILNPAVAEMAGFSRVHASGDGEASGCVMQSEARICGRVLPDTGGNGLVVEARQRPSSFPWPDGTAAALEMDAVKIPFQVHHVPGTPEALHWEQSGRPEPRIAGVLPFMDNAVLFDSRAHEIGFKPR